MEDAMSMADAAQQRMDFARGQEPVTDAAAGDLSIASTIGEEFASIDQAIDVLMTGADSTERFEALQYFSETLAAGGDVSGVDNIGGVMDYVTAFVDNCIDESQQISFFGELSASCSE